MLEHASFGHSYDEGRSRLSPFSAAQGKIVRLQGSSDKGFHFHVSICSRRLNCSNCPGAKAPNRGSMPSRQPSRCPGDLESRLARPVLNPEAGNPAELTLVIGNKDQFASNRLPRNQRV